jgi:hypothetical protein
MLHIVRLLERRDPAKAPRIVALLLMVSACLLGAGIALTRL